jgi:DNA-binding NarL/FixJ family response regulator
MFCRLTRLSAGGPLAGLIDELERARRCRFVTLRALDPGAAAELIQSSLEYRAPVEMSEIVRERTAGDPFLIQELSRALRGQPVEAAARLIPDTVIGLTELRLAALSQPALEATQLSSAFNGAFALDALAAAADLPPQEALAAMRAAEQAGLVQTTDDDQFELVAPLVRDAVRAIAFGGAGREVDRRISEALAVAPSRAEEPVMPILSPQAQDGLTRRQLEVLLLLSEGLTNQEIAERLVVSINTVNRHVSDTYRKIGVSNRVGAAAYAARTGLTSVRESAALVM